MTAPIAVVFDNDGVLVDSEPIALDVWCELLDEHGVGYEPREVDALVGLTDPAAHAQFAGRRGMPALQPFLVEFEERRNARFRRELRPFPDAWDAVRQLAAEGVRLGVATNATRDVLELTLAITGLDRYFEAAVARTDVAAGKPAPDVYLAAAARLGVDPSRCLALEDSPTGAAAAAGAGMRVVTVARDGHSFGGYASVPSIDAELILSWMGLR
jgi:HAD superfamily hydrolase (TIGR01509 family)